MRFAYGKEEEEQEVEASGKVRYGMGNIMCVFRICALCAIYELTFLNEVNSQHTHTHTEEEG